MKVLDLEGLGYFWTKIKNKFYIKPDTGIPKSDLSSEVQGSLNKADTALLTETDPIFTASPAHGISSEDIVRWNNLESLGISTLSLSIDSSTYVLTLSGTKIDGTSFVVPNPVDFPLESVVVSGSYDSASKKVILTLKDGSTIDFSIADLVSGLLTEITSTNKLSADLVEDGTTNKVYTATEKTKLSGIASGAEVNVQSDWNVTNASSDAYILNKPDLSIYAQSSNLATVATSGSYNDLSDKPTIPTVNNGTLSISGPSGGSTVTTDVFHANLSGDSFIAFSPGTNTTINVNSSTRTITIGTTAEPNVQSNWNETNTSSDAYILNKPNIPSASNTAPKMDATTAVVGTEVSFARGDHQHPKDSTKQDTLVSGTNIKTINGESILGSGDFNVTGDCIAYPSFEIDSHGHLIMSGGQQGLFTLENGHLMYNF